VYPHIGDLTKLAGYPPLKLNIIFCDYLLDCNSSKIARWCQDCRFQVTLQRKSIFGTYHISITSLPEDKQTSKHGGGGRYNAILEFKGDQIKNEKDKERKRKKSIKKKRKNICMRKKEKYEYV
jgi:hypothetical protein